jgi:hypothetical protein
MPSDSLVARFDSVFKKDDSGCDLSEYLGHVAAASFPREKIVGIKQVKT